MNRTRAAENRSAERGSAYIVALMALLVLTLGGLSVALITQTEAQVGRNEQAIQRVFYGAESGANLATAYILTNGGRCFPADSASGWRLGLDIQQRGDSHFGAVAQVAPAMILFKGCCNWCPCQENPDVPEVDRFTYGMYSEAQRVGWTDSSPATEIPLAGTTVLAEKTVGTMVDVQPLQPSGNEQCLTLSPDALKIKF